METIKVNMTPCEDVQTIHASQNDNEAREWGFALHNNGDAIDSSEISDQLVFKAYKGGTEEILPTNGSVPTTSPFKGDIRYPQGLLTDQEFTYRQSPTESDGNAKIQAIYGNTLKWNQLMRNGNFADGTSYYYVIASTLTASNGVLTITKDQNAGQGIGYAGPTNFNYVVGHKFLARVDYKGIAGKMLTVFSNSFNSGKTSIIPTDENWHTVSNIFNVTALPTVAGILWLAYETTTDDNVAQFRNYAIFDLTAIGIDSLTDAEIYQWFADYYPLPYYQYDSGSLLPFRGEGLKTVGFNQWDEETRTDGYFNITGGWTNGTTVSSVNPIPVFPDTDYYLCEKDGNAPIYVTQWTEPVQSGSNHEAQFISRSDAVRNAIFRTAPNCHAIHINCGSAYGNVYKNDICINISSSKNGTYEPYTSSTLSLPIPTYFPSGMKSAGNVYDELTESKAITRIGSVDLGTLDWSYSAPYAMFVAALNSMKQGEPKNLKCTLYEPVNYWVSSTEWANHNMIIATGGNDKLLRIKNTSYTDATAFKTAMSGVYLYYELATPTETSFTTASLVTENAEIPLSNEDGVLIGKCTEELSAEPGFHDAKIKLSDSDGECYSNKIQLHVERSPQ